METTRPEDEIHPGVLEGDSSPEILLRLTQPEAYLLMAMIQNDSYIMDIIERNIQGADAAERKADGFNLLMRLKRLMAFWRAPMVEPEPEG